MPENKEVAKSYIGKPLMEIIRINGLDGWTPVVDDDDNIIDMIPVLEDADIVYQSVMGYTIDPHTDIRYDDTKEAYEMRNDYMAYAKVKPEQPERKEMPFHCNYCEKPKTGKLFVIGEYPNRKLKCVDCHNKEEQAKKESKDIEIEVAYTYKAKIGRLYLEYMISDGITTGLFGKYTDFIDFEEPKGFIGKKPENVSERIMKGWKIHICDKDDKTMTGVLSLETIIKAIQTMALQYPHLYRDALLKEDYDAISAGAMLEIAAFGKIVYG